MNSQAADVSSAKVPLYPRLPGRVPCLDGLRALSVAAVFLGHGAMSGGAPRLLQYFRHGGNLGVRCFFIISGFLITTLLLKEFAKNNRISLSAFYTRRALRIFPASFVFLATISALVAFRLIRHSNGDLVHAWTYTLNYRYQPYWWFDHLWSLSVEEQFYLLWPGLICLLGLRRAFRGCLLAILLVPLVRGVMWYYLGASDSAMTKHFECVADALSTGCLLSYYFNALSDSRTFARFCDSWFFWPAVLALIVGGNFLFLLSAGAFYVVGQTMVNVGIALGVYWTIRHADSLAGRFLNAAPLVFIGTVSYSLYLWQNPFLNPYGKTWATRFPTNLIVAFAVGVTSYFVVEKPFLLLKSRFGSTPKTSKVSARGAEASRQASVPSTVG